MPTPDHMPQTANDLLKLLGVSQPKPELTDAIFAAMAREKQERFEDLVSMQRAFAPMPDAAMKY
jgi:hypothetical protein